MFGKRFTLFKLLGFEIRIDISWFVIVVLITWTLGVNVFPMQYEGLAPATYLWMGVAGALGLFASIVFHELSHSVVARKFDIPIKGITLFIFGGVAEMEKEPPNPKAEFLMAIAGPAASFFLCVTLFLAYTAAAAANLPAPIGGVLQFVAYMNGILAAFNLVPAFPLDGGRVLRAILWAWKDNIRWATRITSQMGSTFGTVLIVLGILAILQGQWLGGFWWCLIGLFVRIASQSSYQQLLLRRALEGEPISRFMVTDPVCVSPTISVQDLVDDFVYARHHKLFPVVEDGQLLGCVTTQEIKQIPRAEWDSRRVGEIVCPPSAENTIEPAADAMKALATMSHTKKSRLMVVDQDRLVGLVTLKDLLQFIELKVDLELGD